jgi:hypothetical protein
MNTKYINASNAVFDTRVKITRVSAKPLVVIVASVTQQSQSSL